MAMDYRVGKIKDKEPEAFVVVGFDWVAGNKGSISREFSEQEIRSHLREQGWADKDIEAQIENAREHPV